jgi:hypothetical protein
MHGGSWFNVINCYNDIPYILAFDQPLTSTSWCTLFGVSSRATYCSVVESFLQRQIGDFKVRIVY